MKNRFDKSTNQITQTTTNPKQGYPQQFADYISDGVVCMDKHGVILYANKAAISDLRLVIEQKDDQISFMPGWKFVGEDLHALSREEHPDRIALFSGQPVKNKVMGMSMPGEDGYRWMSVNSFPEYEAANPKPQRVITTYRDITNEFNAKKEQQEKQELFVHLLNSVEIGIWVKDGNGQLLFVNSQVKNIFRSNETTLFKNNSDFFLNFVHQEDKGYVTSKIRNHFISQENVHLEWRLIRPDQSLRNVRSSLIHYKLSQKNSTSWSVGFITDITEQKMALAKVQQDNMVADELSRIKSALISSISHEFRTPITGIIGFSALLRDLMENEEANSYLNYIENSTKRLHRVLESILAYSVLYSEKQEIRPQEFDIQETLVHILHEYELKCELKELYFQSFFSNETVVFSDKYILTSVITELLENAFKFTPDGGIKLHIHSKNKRIYIRVEDTGVGIPANQNLFIFEPFRQIDGGDASLHDGTGLGLAILMRQVDLLNGSARFETNEYNGTSFTVEIPFMTDNRLALSDGSKSFTSSKDISILYVDDNSTLTTLVKLYLKDYDVSVALNYGTALEMASEKQFDLVLLDINLKASKDGIMLCKELRQLKSYADTPFIMITAYSLDQVEQYLKPGIFDDYIGKPFLDKYLLQKINAHFTRINVND